MKPFKFSVQRTSSVPVYALLCLKTSNHGHISYSSLVILHLPLYKSLFWTVTAERRGFTISEASPYRQKKSSFTNILKLIRYPTTIPYPQFLQLQRNTIHSSVRRTMRRRIHRTRPVMQPIDHATLFVCALTLMRCRYLV